MRHTGATKSHTNFSKRDKFHGKSLTKHKFDRSKGKNHRKEIERFFTGVNTNNNANNAQVR